MLGLGIASIVFGALQSTKSQASKTPPDKPDPAVIQVNQRFAQAKPEDYTGDAACVDCHTDTSHRFAESAHFGPVADSHLPLAQRGCEGCHGPGKAHQDDPDANKLISFVDEKPKDSAAACLRCHAQTMAASHWTRSVHAKANLSCVTCHQVHPDTDLVLEKGVLNKGHIQDPRTLIRNVKQPEKNLLLKTDEVTLCGQCHSDAVSQFRASYHHPVPEGQLACSDCHSVHPSKASQIRSTPFKDNCVVCHQEKAGPFIFEHDPVAGFGNGGCLECHAPHGSNNPDMLIGVTRGLCAQCHSDKLATHHPGQTCWSAGCHVAPHGSNSSSLFLGY